MRRPDAADGRDQPRLALLLRALAAYADQRWDVGDAATASLFVRRAWQLVPRLGNGHTKERLGVMIADGRVFGLNGRDDRDRFHAAEKLAERSGYVHALAVARAERITTEIRILGGTDVFERALESLDLCERSAPWTVGTVAVLALQVETHVERRVALAGVVQRTLAPRSGPGLIACSLRARAAFDAGRFDEARAVAHDARNAAVACGNPRVRGSAERMLAAVAVAQRRRRDAARHLDVAVPVLERYGTWLARDDAATLARTLDAGAPRVYLSANIGARAAM